MHERYPPVLLQVRPSKIFRLLYGMLLATALIGLLLSGLSWYWQMSGIILTMLVAHQKYHEERYDLVLDSERHLYRKDANDSEWYALPLTGQAFIHPYLIALPTTPRVILWPDSAEAEDLRRCRLRLLHLPTHTDTSTAFIHT